MNQPVTVESLRLAGASLGGLLHGTRYAGAPPDLALVTCVYGEQALAPDQVFEVLRPYGGDFRDPDVYEQDQPCYPALASERPNLRQISNRLDDDRYRA